MKPADDEVSDDDQQLVDALFTQPLLGAHTCDQHEECSLARDRLHSGLG